MAKASLSMWFLLLLTWMLLPGRAAGMPGAQAPHWTSPMGQEVSVQRQHVHGSMCLRRLLDGEGAPHCEGIPWGVPFGELQVPAR